MNLETGMSVKAQKQLAYKREGLEKATGRQTQPSRFSSRSKCAPHLLFKDILGLVLTLSGEEVLRQSE